MLQLYNHIIYRIRTTSLRIYTLRPRRIPIIYLIIDSLEVLNVLQDTPTPFRIAFNELRTTSNYVTCFERLFLTPSPPPLCNREFVRIKHNDCQNLFILFSCVTLINIPLGPYVIHRRSFFNLMNTHYNTRR